MAAALLTIYAVFVTGAALFGVAVWLFAPRYYRKPRERKSTPQRFIDEYHRHLTASADRQ